MRESNLKMYIPRELIDRFEAKNRLKDLSREIVSRVHTRNLSIGATEADIHRWSELVPAAEIIRRCFCAWNGYKLKQPIGKGTLVDQCQELVSSKIAMRKIRASRPSFNFIPHCFLFPTPSKNREINGGNFELLCPLRSQFYIDYCILEIPFDKALFSTDFL